MPLALSRLHPHFGVEVHGLDLRRPLPPDTFAEVAAAFNEHSLVVFRAQAITDEQQVEFSRRFGPLEPQIRSIIRNDQLPREVFDLSNVDPDGRLIPPDDRRMLYHSGNQLWHSDSSYKPAPSMASLLSAREVPPEGGETEFASMRAAHAALSGATRARVADLVAIHDFAYSRGLVAPGLLTSEQRAALPPVPQRMVRVNPVNGRPSLFIGAHASSIVGLPLEEGRALLRELLDFVTRPEFVYSHRWRTGDLVMWDNRCLLHRGRPWDAARHRRVMHRTTVAGDGPTVPDEEVAATGRAGCA